MADDGYLKLQRGRERFELLEADGYVTVRITTAGPDIVVADWELTPAEVEKLQRFLGRIS